MPVLHDEEVDWTTSDYPPADISPAEFEDFVAQLLRSARTEVEGLSVKLHDKVTSADGTYDLDATVRFNLAGMQFFVIVEAKRHKNPIKRELIRILHQKVLSLGAQKGVMISTAPYQRGAVAFAETHGIALATVTEGRYTLIARSSSATAPMSRAEALATFDTPIFVGHYYARERESDTTAVTLLSPEYPEYVVEMLTGQPVEAAQADSSADSNSG
jgi:hypothetical protein